MVSSASVIRLVPAACIARAGAVDAMVNCSEQAVPAWPAWCLLPAQASSASQQNSRELSQ